MDLPRSSILALRSCAVIFWRDPSPVRCQALKPLDPKGNRNDDQWDPKLSTTCDAGCYSYKVDVLTTKRVPAVGESDPVVIIDI